ncbi:DUF4302 domain-containing protein [Chitinophaga vietnamensis]|uniref:DUF4302 domain-containing protein n=1 Tax=Chitinophaga vietnamensis TaxID=2593957 RepID=UPI0011779FDC|nr:DUF4302 domain-containing protein [Chitinophaga vietnamensis]
MKKYCLYILLLAAVFTACNKNSDDKIFDKSPDERLNATLADYQAKLVAAPYGWKMTVVPGDTSEPYVFYFWLRFNNQNRVIERMDTLPAMESSFRLKAMMQPELIFDTYSYLHMLSDPTGAVPGAVVGKGLQADFEYEMRYVSADSIVLYGKYNGSYAKLVKAAAGDSATFTDNLFRLNNYLSGNYVSSGKRTLYAGAISNNVVTGAVALGGVKTLALAYPGAYAVDYADLGSSGWQYILSFDANAKKITAVAPSASLASQITAGSFKVISVNYDDTQKQIYLKTSYVNTAGNGRVVEETLTRQ